MCATVVIFHLVAQFVSKIDPKSIIDVTTIRGELDALLTEKMELLTAARVKKVRPTL